MDRWFDVGLSARMYVRCFGTRVLYKRPGERPAESRPAVSEKIWNDEFQ